MYERPPKRRRHDKIHKNKPTAKKFVLLLEKYPRKRVKRNCLIKRNYIRRDKKQMRRQTDTSQRRVRAEFASYFGGTKDVKCNAK